MRLALIVETNRCQGLDDLLLIGENALVGEDELEDGSFFLGAIDVVLDVERADLVRGGEAFNLTVGDGAHQRRLSGTVLTAETVSVTTFETEGSRVEQNLGTVSQGELAVAKIFALLLIVSNGAVVDALSGRLYNPLTCDGSRVVRGDESEVRCECVPLRNIEVLDVDSVGGESGGVDGRGVGDGGKGSDAELLVDLDKSVTKLSPVCQFVRWQVRPIAFGDLSDLTQSCDGTANNTAGFWITDGLLNLEKAGKEFRQERPDNNRVVNKLGHVVHNAIDDGVSKAIM